MGFFASFVLRVSLLLGSFFFFKEWRGRRRGKSLFWGGDLLAVHQESKERGSGQSSQSSDLVRLRFAIRITNREPPAVARPRCCDFVHFIRVARLKTKFPKKSRNWNEVSEIFSEICSEIRPEISPENFRASLAGRKVLPPKFTRVFPSEISNFKLNSNSNFTKNVTNTLLQAWQP